MIWVERISCAHYSDEGKLLRIVGMIADISERKRVEDELRKQKEVFQKIFENIPAMIAFVNKDHRLELVNPEWERAMGWTMAEIRERDLDIFTVAYPDPQY